MIVPSSDRPLFLTELAAGEFDEAQFLISVSGPPRNP